MSRITVRNRQRTVPVKIAALQRFAENALKECIKLEPQSGGALLGLDEVNVVLVSDQRMANLHQRFLNEDGPTDVITFQHGEIVIGTETARRQAGAFRTSLEDELCLYIAHGLLHLCGYDDRTRAGAAVMKRTQEKLVARVGRLRKTPDRLIPSSGVGRA